MQNAPQATTPIPSNKGNRIASNPMSNITNYPTDKDSAAHRDADCVSALILEKTLENISKQESSSGFTLAPQTALINCVITFGSK